MMKTLYILFSIFLILCFSSCTEVVNSDENIIKERVYSIAEIERNIFLKFDSHQYFNGDTVPMGPFYNNYTDITRWNDYGFFLNIPNTKYKLNSITLDTGKIEFDGLPNNQKFYADFYNNSYYILYDKFDMLALYIDFEYYKCEVGVYTSKIYINDNKNLYWVLKCTVLTKN